MRLKPPTSETDYIKRVRSDYMLTTLPFPRDSIAPVGEVSPEPLDLPVRKEAQEE